MNLQATINSDMIWNIGDQRYKESSVGFLNRFKESLCMFSETVRQLYSNYELFNLPTDVSRVVAMPDQFAYHETYNDIPKEAIKPTGIYVIPSELRNEYEVGDLCLAYLSNKTGKLTTVPLKKGLAALQKKFESQGKFLPVIINKDLMFRKDNLPIMHLHRLDLAAMKNLSEFQKRDISSAVEDKMNTLLN